jgi:S-formylglutathione hydrolase FrmB
MLRLLLFLFALPIVSGSIAARVDTVDIYSASMKKSSRCVVITPGNIGEKNIKYPVVYLLHGYSGSYWNWITRVPSLKKYSDELGLIIVCPDGHKSSWYIDSPLDSTMQYETYISREVSAYIDAHYPTIRSREGRAITGLSMGGHGGLFIGFRQAGNFGACGSMSGGVELFTSRNSYDISKRIGDTINYRENWKTYSVMHVVEKYPQDSIAVIIDCGTEDFFYSINRSLHDKMLTLKIPHEYIERPGKHDWAYWAKAVKYQLIFFRDYFDRGKGSREGVKTGRVNAGH